MSQKNLTYRIGADIGELRREMEAAGTLTRKWQRELDNLEAKQQAHRQALTDLGQGFLAFGAVVTAGLAVAGKAAMDWETAFTGVRKTVDGSPQEIAELEGELRRLARTLPSTHEQIAAVAEAAGQLGIKRQDIAAFTKVMLDLGNTTNLTAEDAAAELAKFSNIMGTSASNADRLGSALVALGNDGASTEADIVSMALRIAGAGRQIGLTEAQVLGFASALSSVGIEAEAGGSSISRVMVTIEQAVRGGGKEVEQFARVAGMSASEFARAYRDDAGSAIVSFIAGLQRIQKSGGDVFGVLAELGFSEILVRDALLRTAGASDMLAKSLRVGSKAWEENNALTEEANKRYETSASKLAVAGNVIKDTLIDVGGAIAPVATKVATAVSDMVRAFQNLPGPVKDVVTWVGAGAAAIALFGGAALIAVPKVLAFRESMRGLIDVGGGMSGALGRFGMFMSGPWGAAIGVGVSLLGLFAAKTGAAQREQEALAGNLREVASALREQNGQANESIRASIAKAAQDAKWANGQKNVLSASKELGVQTGLVTDAILDQGNAYQRVSSQLDDIIKAGAEARKQLNSSDPAVAAAADRELANRAANAEILKRKIDELRGSMGGQVSADKEVADASKGAADATKEQAEQQQNLKKQTEEAVAALNDLVKALDAINGVTLSYRDAQRGYLQQIVDTNEALATNGKTLDINTEAGRKNLEALDAQAKAANDLAEAAAREAESTGGAAAGAAAMAVSLDASRAKLIETAESFGMSRDEAVKYTDSVLGIPQPPPTLMKVDDARALAQLENVKRQIESVPPGREVNVGVLDAVALERLRNLGFTVRTLPDGTVAVTANDQRARDSLASLITTVNNSRATMTVDLRPRTTGLGMGAWAPIAQGGIIGYAGGGIHENHAPQIAKATPGMVRVWAEPETDNESYIPWALDRRRRAVGVLGATADAFGFALVPKSQMVAFAHGGVSGANGAFTQSAAMPSTLVVVDANGLLLGQLRVAANQALAGEAREVQLRGRQ